MNVESAGSCHFSVADAPHTSEYVTPIVTRLCRDLNAKTVLDLGCGNGALCATLARQGFDVSGCDPSQEGIEIASEMYPELSFVRLSAYDDPKELAAKQFDVVVSTEVVEHLYFPRALPRFARQVLRPGGHLIVSTPFHGYLKNLLLSVAGRWDSHLSPFWDGGHIKFWSRSTLMRLVEEEGFAVTEFVGAGRVPYLWKSMVVAAQKIAD